MVTRRTSLEEARAALRQAWKAYRNDAKYYHIFLQSYLEARQVNRIRLKKAVDIRAFKEAQNALWTAQDDVIDSLACLRTSRARCRRAIFRYRMLLDAANPASCTF